MNNGGTQPPQKVKDSHKHWHGVPRSGRNKTAGIPQSPKVPYA